MKSARLYGILDLGYVGAGNVVAMAEKMVVGGVEILQLRAKGVGDAEIIELARLVVPICRASRVTFILNDHPALVAACGADGVHVGQDDVSVAEARRMAGPKKLVGKSTHSLAQARAAAAEGADYLGFGPLFATPTKPDYPAIGLEDVAEVHRLVDVPTFCIGGIKRENVSEVLAAGARRVVIVSGILLAEDPETYCRECGVLLAAAARAAR